MTWRPSRVWLGLGLLVVIAGVGVAVIATGHSDQPRVSAGIFPLISDAAEGTTYVDCSKIDAVAYDSHNPCETFILVDDSRVRSAAAFLLAEQHALQRAGWRVSAPQPTDYNQGASAASVGESWISTAQRACAYLAPVQRGAAAEAKGLFPYDAYNQPNEVLDFYRQAKGASGNQTLWVRLRPSYGDQC